MNSSVASVKEIATAVGCSPRVAAAVLNPGNSNIRVGAATQQRILAKASELGYRPNELARTMATGKSRVLGLVRGEQTEHGGWMLAGAIEAANALGYTSKILFAAHDKVPRQVIEHCIEWRLAGLVAISMNARALDYLCDKAGDFQIPLAVIDNVPGDFQGVCATSDEHQGIFQVVEHLFAQGHRAIGFLGGEAESSSSQQREVAFRQVLAHFDLPIREAWITHSDWFRMPVIEAAVQKLLQGEMPSAIVCAGDPLAMVMIRAARAAGVQVPAQLSVTGFANFDLSGFADPPLTTVEQSFSQMGNVATAQLIAQLEGETTHQPSDDCQKIPTRLVIRGSTAPPSRPAMAASLSHNPSANA